MQRVHALIPAAGQSVRFGGTTLKQYAHLLGKPVIAQTIDALRWHPMITAVTVALAPDDGIYAELIGPDYPGVQTTVGGDVRAQTVLNGLRYIRNYDPECNWVLVHDAARPCLPGYALENLLYIGSESEDGALLALPLQDTIKLAGAEQTVAQTIDRSLLWAAQTPQLFQIDPLIRNLQAAISFGEPPTDEAEAMERAGCHPLLVQGSPYNIKITGPDDLAMAEFALSRLRENRNAS